MEGFTGGEDLIPQKYRAVIYRVLTAAFLVEQVLDLMSPGVEAKVLAIAGVFGFGLATAYTPRKG